MRLRATVAYDGGLFHGFAANRGVRTVSGDITAALSRCLGQPVQLTCAGRTDAGVHARGQVISFDLPAPYTSTPNTKKIDLVKLRNSLNKMLSPSIAVQALTHAPNGFDARFDALSRTYRYSVLNDEAPDPFLANTTWHYPHRLDIQAMNTAAQHLLGTHDFTSFCRRQHSRDGSEKSRVRHIHNACWHTHHVCGYNKQILQFEITASSFCHQMVRSITGTLVHIGANHQKAADIISILSAKDRAQAPNLAPPQGLCLWEVTYPADLSF